MSRPLLSLCMPTNGVIEWVFPVLDSIYSQGCDKKLFEVVITDNGENAEFKEKVKEYKKHHANLLYVETKALPFLNEIESYKRASGELIKFVNHRTKLISGVLQKLINFAEENKDEKPVTYFTNGVLKIEKRKYEYKTFDEFVRNLSYWSSWSTGMTIWKSDFEKLPEKVEDFNELFPHTNVLFGERCRNKYVIDNSVIFDELPVNGIPKARYDIFYAFSVEYLYIILELYRDNSISISTFKSVKSDLLFFILEQYRAFIIKRRPCSYDLTNFKSVYVFYTHMEVCTTYLKLRVNQILRKIMRLGKSLNDE